MAVRSHKMPKAYLKLFAELPNRRKTYGKLCVYERGKPPRIGTPHSEAAERGFFTARSKDGVLEDSTAENWAQKIEYESLDTLICAPSSMFVWTNQSRRKMAEYWALMFLRSTSFYDFHKRGSDGIFRANIRRLNEDAEFRQKLVSHYSQVFGRPFTEGEVVGTIGRAVTGLLSEEELRSQYVRRLKWRVNLFSGVLLNKPWQIWTSPSGCEFVTCDSPVMTFRLDNWGKYYVGDGLGKPDSIIILPISPAACLLAGVEGPQSRHIPRSDVHELNKIIISSASRFVYSKTRDVVIDDVVQRFAGSIQYGTSAFARGHSDDFLFF